MVSEEILSWQKRRSEFNHDWMKNRYLQALRSWLRLLSNNKVSDKITERTFIADTFPQWKIHYDEAIALANDFETEMSPKILFKEPPLTRCDDDTKYWLGELVHALWVDKYSVKALTSNTIELIAKTNQAYNILQTALQTCADTKNIEALRCFKPLFDEFCKYCESLSGAIEKFPSEIRVV
jgi:hypothetical protein